MCSFFSVTRLVIVRLLVLACGLIASLATPVLALAHGYAHHELMEHSAPATHHASEGAVVSPQEHGPEHQHASVTAGLTARWSSPSLALLSATVLAPLAQIVLAPDDSCAPSSRVVPYSAEPPPNLTRAPPGDL